MIIDAFGPCMDYNQSQQVEVNNNIMLSIGQTSNFESTLKEPNRNACAFYDLLRVSEILIGATRQRNNFEVGRKNDTNEDTT